MLAQQVGRLGRPFEPPKHISEPAAELCDKVAATVVRRPLVPPFLAARLFVCPLAGYWNAWFSVGLLPKLQKSDG